MKISDFYKTEYVDQASYDNLRKIASVVDGQKNASRKILYAIMEKGIKSKIKVSQLGSKVSEFSEYLHGNLDGVIVNLAQDFVGTNNIALIQKNGNFGTRFTPAPSASRYIFAYGTDLFFDLFKKEDNAILKKQTFEGHQIEPMFYVPSLPILLVNGSEGVSSGYAQKILPRDPKQLTKYIRSKLSGKNPSVKLDPWFQGFTGTVEQGENTSQWIIKGVAVKSGINRVRITEIPITYNLKSYLKILDDLEDKKIIQGYTDMSEDDNFLFEVNVHSKSLKSWSSDELLTRLKLTKTISENYTCINEYNKISIFDNTKDIINKYIEVKLDYMVRRKDNLIMLMEDAIRYDFSKYVFIKYVTDDNLKINKRKKKDIVKDLDCVEKILKKDDNYDYLLRMPLYNLTDEEMKKLQDKIKATKKELDELTNKSTEQLWLDDLK